MSTVLEHHRTELLARMRAATDPEALFEDVSRRLRRLVQFDAPLWFATDPATGLRHRARADENLPGWRRRGLRSRTGSSSS